MSRIKLQGKMANVASFKSKKSKCKLSKKTKNFSKVPKVPQKRYQQHFRTAWLGMRRFQPWLRAVPKDSTKAACSICVSLLHTHVKALDIHRQSKKHIANLQLRPFGHLNEDELDKCINLLLTKKLERKIILQGKKCDQWNKDDHGKKDDQVKSDHGKNDVPDDLLEQLDDSEIPDLMQDAVLSNSDVHYRVSWERDPLFNDWIAKVPGDVHSVYCTICMVVLKARHKNLMVHRRGKNHLKNLANNFSLKSQTSLSMGSGKILKIAGCSVKVLEQAQIHLNAALENSQKNEETVQDVLEIIEEPVDLVEGKISSDGESLRSHCLICNTSVSQHENAIDIFSSSQVTSHRKLPPFVVLGGALKYALEKNTVHTDTICSRCFTLLDDIDGAEVQLTKMRMDVSSQYKKTLKQIGSPWSDMFEVSSQKAVCVPTIEPLKNNRRKCAKMEMVQEHIIIDMGDNVEPSVISRDSTCLTMNWSQMKSEMLEEVEEIDNEGNYFDEGIEGDKELVITKVEEEEISHVISNKTKHHQTNDKVHYDCPHCPKRYISKGMLDEHVNLHTGTKPFRCHHCNAAFPMAKMLRHHLAEHNDTQSFLPYICGQCNETFKTNASLDNHSWKKHGVESALSKMARSYMCDLCGKVLSSKKALVEHTAFHSNPDERPFQCELCGSTFRLKCNLLSHVRCKHNRDPPLQCDACGKTLSSRKMLRYHKMSAHTGERPYACNECNSSFFCSSHLAKHKKMHTGSRPFACDKCGKTFSNRDNIKMHLYTHTKVKPFQCSHCSLSFMRRRQLLLHTEEDHPGMGDASIYMSHQDDEDNHVVIMEEYSEISSVEIQVL